ncbi:MAG: hypothetical protein ACRDOJ_05120 [Nocardioidaceae bacterium]
MSAAHNDPPVRPFADFLREQASGRTHDELGESLHDLVDRVRDTGKKGSVTLTVTVAPMKDDIDTLVISDEIKLRLPEHDRKASIFYPDEHGNLTRRDPRQLDFDSLREVPKDNTPDRDNLKESR